MMRISAPSAAVAASLMTSLIWRRSTEVVVLHATYAVCVTLAVTTATNDHQWTLSHLRAPAGDSTAAAATAAVATAKDVDDLLQAQRHYCTISLQNVALMSCFIVDLHTYTVRHYVYTPKQQQIIS